MERTEYDCFLLLLKYDVPREVINKVIEYAKENKWLSNERYALMFAESSVYNGYSPLDVAHRLREKKISGNIIKNAIDTVYNKEIINNILNDLIDKLIRISNEKTDKKKFEKIMNTLYRKGFNFNDYENILKEKLGIY
jgi:SOS response regulatory protein OraA/RecX